MAGWRGGEGGSWRGWVGPLTLEVLSVDCITELFSEKFYTKYRSQVWGVSVAAHWCLTPLPTHMKRSIHDFFMVLADNVLHFFDDWNRPRWLGV